MPAQIKIILVDDHPVVRQGLRLMIETDNFISIAGEAGDGHTALSLIEAHQPDVVLLDIDMPEMDGFEVARKMKEKRLAGEIVFLTMHGEEELFYAAMDLGVKGYVLKDSAANDIIKSIQTVAHGQSYLSPALSSLILERHRRSEKFEKKNPTIQILSPTERRILRYIADDKTTQDIADALFISYRTVEKHRSNIRKKLDLQGNLALVKFALKHKSDI